MNNAYRVLEPKLAPYIGGSPTVGSATDIDVAVTPTTSASEAHSLGNIKKRYAQSQSA